MFRTEKDIKIRSTLEHKENALRVDKAMNTAWKEIESDEELKMKL